MADLRAGYAGEGSYAEEAALALYPDAEAASLADFTAGAVARAVWDAEVEPGRPAARRTSLAGLVPDTLTVLEEGWLSIVEETVLPIPHCLIGVPGAAAAEVRVVHSHPMALAQCRSLLANGFETVGARSTAEAARTVAARGDRTHAAVASPLAARTYGLEVLVEDVSDHGVNYSRFVSPGPVQPHRPRGPSRVAVGAALRHPARAGRAARRHRALPLPPRADDVAALAAADRRAVALPVLRGRRGTPRRRARGPGPGRRRAPDDVPRGARLVPRYVRALRRVHSCNSAPAAHDAARRPGTVGLASSSVSTANLAPDGRTPPTPAAAAQRGLFGSGGELAKEIQRAVETSLTAAAKRRGKAQLYRKAAVSIGLMVGAWSVLILASPGPVLALACLAALVAGAVLTGFAIQHDANHGAYSSNAVVATASWASLPRPPRGRLRTCGTGKHNIFHHTYTNIEGADHNLNAKPFGRLAPAQTRHRAHRFQHIYMWGLYGFIASEVAPLVDDFQNALGGGFIDDTPRIPRPRGWDLLPAAGWQGGVLRLGPRHPDVLSSLVGRAELLTARRPSWFRAAARRRISARPLHRGG